MEVLLYDNLNPAKINGFEKFRKALQANNFAQAEVKKLGDNLYRARLNQRDRLLFALYRHQQQQYCLALEYLPNHAYEKSRFLAGADIDEDKIQVLNDLTGQESPELAYINPQYDRFHLLDKVLSFDDAQVAIFRTPAPVVIIGSAGSGKTALMLEKMKQGVGDILYISHSPYLVKNAHKLYYAYDYQNDLQEQVDFLSFGEYLETIAVPAGREVNRHDFDIWFNRQGVKHKLIKDSHKLFEEFKGVLTGPAIDAPFLNRDEYLQLGVRQSLYGDDVRETVYELFEKYLNWLSAANLYDGNIISQQYLQRVTPQYDFVVVDEVQDITSIQLMLILRSLRRAGEFVLCGDANQVVHPNFFSWSGLKSLFFEQTQLTAANKALHILHANYRNSPLVTNVANRILKLKHARFGSVDKESNYLVESIGQHQGKLQLLESNPKVIGKLDASTARSTKFAVVVLQPAQKHEASRLFSTPLVFSIQEAKGLEYDNIILYNFITDEEQAYKAIAGDVQPEALEVESLVYARAKSKHDKSLEVYKFYINALYVAVTRAVHNLYIIEGNLLHPIMKLLDLDRYSGELVMEKQESSLEEWQQEARRLELQGKQQQAEAIRSRILSEERVPWQPLTPAAFANLKQEALSGNNKKSRLLAMEYALLHQDNPTLTSLIKAEFLPAKKAVSSPLLRQKAMKALYQRHFMLYDLKHATGVVKAIEKYGVNHRTIFNMTPLMQAAIIGNVEAAEAVARRGADNSLTANHGLNAWQMALRLGLSDEKFARLLAPMHACLAPEAIAIQVDGKLEKLDERKMFGFLVNVFFALWYDHMSRCIAFREAITANDLAEMLARLPDQVLAPMMKQRAYISRYLSDNEVDRDMPRNKKLFKRLKRGHYVLNSQLKIRIGESWKDLHEVLAFEGWGYIPDSQHFANTNDLITWHQQNARYFDNNIKWFKEYTRGVSKPA